MRNNTFHNDRSIIKNLDKKEPFSPNYIDKKINVDINRLLNRVKLDYKNEKKEKIIFFSLSVLLLSSMGVFITIIK
jgi:hypothetical protein|tara:strand:+ start:390 stop:617 length:228 start_codon:yes stop_codon:yes gene_type:complete